MSGEEFVEKAEVISAVRGYENGRTRRKEKVVDFTVSPSESDEKILIRVITESGYVGVSAVRSMNDVLEKRDYDKGILVGKRFTEAAISEMKSGNIEAVSERISPHFTLERIYSAIDGCIRSLCRAKCNQVPAKESDCKGYVDNHYACNVRLISDNASFHLERGWAKSLERDLVKLLAIEKALNG